MLNQKDTDIVIKTALLEDMPSGDITSENSISSSLRSRAAIRAKEEGILAGMEIAKRVFVILDPDIEIFLLKNDGDRIAEGECLAEIYGYSIPLLKAERTALNFLQRLSGIATTTRKYVQALEGTQARLLDTRKTTPGLRVFEKYAVKMGGGHNHRMSLSDMVMLKDNHLRLIGNIGEAVSKIRSRIGPEVKIEVETTSLDEVKLALESGADMIMLDNMPDEMMREAVRYVAGRVPLEASGNMNLERIRAVAMLGVDFISVGALTHSVCSLDISMDFL